PPGDRSLPDRIDAGKDQRKADRGENVCRDSQRVALETLFRLPLRLMVMRGAVAGVRVLMLCLSFRLLVDFALLDQRYRREELADGDHGANHQPGQNSREHDSPEYLHWSSVAGEGVRVAHVVGGIMDGADVREANHSDDENAERNGQ